MSRIFLWLTLFVMIGGAGLMVVIHRGAPAAHGLPEVGLGEPGFDTGIVYLSGKRFDCSPLPTEPSGAMRCVLLVNGNLLEIEAHPTTFSPSRFAGWCVARYRGAEHECGEGLRRGTARSIAVIRDGLGLTETEREALRSQYAVENRSDLFLPLYAYSLLLAALIVGAFAFSRGPMPGKKRRERVMQALSVGFVTFLLTVLMGSWSTAFLWS